MKNKKIIKRYVSAFMIITVLFVTCFSTAFASETEINISPRASTCIECNKGVLEKSYGGYADEYKKGQQECIHGYDAGVDHIMYHDRVVSTRCNYCHEPYGSYIESNFYRYKCYGYNY